METHVDTAREGPLTKEDLTEIYANPGLIKFREKIPEETISNILASSDTDILSNFDFLLLLFSKTSSINTEKKILKTILENEGTVWVTGNHLDLFLENNLGKEIYEELKARDLWSIILENYELFKDYVELKEIFEALKTTGRWETMINNLQLFSDNGFGDQIFEILKEKDKWRIILNNYELFKSHVDLEEIFNGLIASCRLDIIINNLQLFSDNGFGDEIHKELKARDLWRIILENYELFKDYVELKEIFTDIIAKSLFVPILNHLQLFLSNGLSNEIFEVLKTNDRWIDILDNYELFEDYVDLEEIFNELKKKDKWRIILYNYELFKDYTDLEEIFDKLKTNGLYGTIVNNPQLFSDNGFGDEIFQILKANGQWSFILNNHELLKDYADLEEILADLITKGLFETILDHLQLFSDNGLGHKVFEVLKASGRRDDILSNSRIFLLYTPNIINDNEFRKKLSLVKKESPGLYNICCADIESHMTTDRQVSLRVLNESAVDAVDLEDNMALFYMHSLMVKIITRLQAQIEMLDNIQSINTFKVIMSAFETLQGITNSLGEQLLTFQIHLRNYTLDAVMSEMSYFEPATDVQRVASSRPIDNNYDSISNYFKACEILFYDHTFKASYGGAKWSHIAETGRLLLESTTLNPTLIDHTIDLEHNTGSFFNKTSSKIRQSSSPKQLKIFLDKKSSDEIRSINDMHNLIKRSFPDKTELLTQVDNMHKTFSEELGKIKRIASDKNELSDLTATVDMLIETVSAQA